MNLKVRLTLSTKFTLIFLVPTPYDSPGRRIFVDLSREHICIRDCYLCIVHPKGSLLHAQMVAFSTRVTRCLSNSCVGNIQITHV